MTPSRFVAILVACALVAGAGVLARGQQRPNFSGRWAIVIPEKGAGQEQVIKHDEKTLTKTPVSQRGGPPATYQIDGVEHRSVMAMGDEQIVIVSRAAWEGNTLVILTNETYPTGQKLTIKEVYSLDDQGRLVIDWSETAERQAPRVMKIVMQKKG